MNNIQYYYPHLGILQTIHMDKLGISPDTLWEEWNNIVNNQASIVEPESCALPKCLVLETEKWEDCCIQE